MINNSNFSNYYTLINEESGQVFSKVLEFSLLDPYNQVITTIQEGFQIKFLIFFLNFFISRTASVQLKNYTVTTNQNTGNGSNTTSNASNTTGNISYNLVGETSVPVKNGTEIKFPL